MSARQEMPHSGSFNAWSGDWEFPNLVLGICRTGTSGELRFMSSEAEKTLVIHNGEIVFAKSSSTDDRLGPYLLREGKIRFEHVTELSRFVTPEKRFGTVLVENRVLSPHELVQGVVGQVRSIVLSLFRWTEAAYLFEPRELEKENITLRIPLARLIVDGVRQVTSWRRVTGGIGSVDAVYQTNDGVEETIRSAKLAPAELELISELRGPKTIAETCASTDLGDFEVCQLLWAFRTLDWIAPVTEQATVPSPSPPLAASPTAEDSTAASAEPMPVIEATAASGDDEDETSDDLAEDLEGLGMILKDDPLA